jgi:spore germination protein GerM
MKGRGSGPRRAAVIAVSFVLFAVVLGIMIQRKYADRHQQPSVPPQAQQAPSVVVTLYFAEPDGDGLKGEGRTIDSCDNPSDCIESVVGELVAGPVGDLEPPLPPALALKEIKLEGDTAWLDFSRDLVDGLPAGSSAEMGAVYAIVNTVCTNVPSVKKVGFLVDGKRVDTLKGHLDLREPILPDFTLVRSEPSHTSETTKQKGANP